MTRSISQAALLAALVPMLFVSRPALAQEDATKQARDHYQKGMVYFQSGDYPNAVAELKQAYQIKHIAALLFNIAQTYRKMDDADMAIFYFEKFLKEAPPTAPQRAEAQKLVGELRAKKGGGQVAVPPPLEGPEATTPGPQQVAPVAPPQRRRRSVDKFEHSPVDETPPQTPLDIRILLPEQEGLRATLYYRTAGQDEYTPLPMHQRYDEWVARIPGESIVGKSFQYYIEAREAGGQVIGKSGSAGAPNIVSIVEGAKPQFYADLTEGTSGTAEEEPAPVARHKKSRRRRRADEDEEDEGPRTLHNFRTWKWTSAAVAASALALGLTFELLASSSSSDVQDKACRPSDGCTTPKSFFNNDLQSSESNGQTFSTLGLVSLIVGGAATVAAITFFAYDDSAEIGEQEREHRRGSRAGLVAPLVTPTPGGGLAWGVSGAFRF
jgi:hypothetical protein